MREKIQAKITTDLGLSSEQVAKLAPLIDRHMEELDSLNQEHHRQIGASMSRQRDRIAGILTPEQRTVFEANEREREQRRSRQRGPSTGGTTNRGPGNPQTQTLNLGSRSLPPGSPLSSNTLGGSVTST